MEVGFFAFPESGSLVVCPKMERLPRNKIGSARVFYYMIPCCFLRSRISLGFQLSSSPPRGRGGTIPKPPDKALLPVKKAFPPLFPRAPHLSPEPRTEALALFPLSHI